MACHLICSLLLRKHHRLQLKASSGGDKTGIRGSSVAVSDRTPLSHADTVSDRARAVGPWPGANIRGTGGHFILSSLCFGHCRVVIQIQNND